MINNVEEILNRAINNGSVVSVFTDITEKQKCSVGFIESFDNDFVLIRHLTMNGEADEYALRKIENIYRIGAGGIYENKLRKLFCIKKESFNIIPYNFDSDNILFNLIFYAKDFKKILEISIDENNEQELIVGLVKSITNDGNIILDKINNYGEYDGIAIINIDDIIDLNCDSKDSRDILLLLEC